MATARKPQIDRKTFLRAVAIGVREGKTNDDVAIELGYEVDDEGRYTAFHGRKSALKREIESERKEHLQRAQQLEASAAALGEDELTDSGKSAEDLRELAQTSKKKAAECHAMAQLFGQLAHSGGRGRSYGTSVSDDFADVLAEVGADVELD